MNALTTLTIIQTLKHCNIKEWLQTSLKHKETAWPWPESFNIKQVIVHFWIEAIKIYLGLDFPTTVDDICHGFFSSVCILYFCSRCTQSKESHECKSNSWRLFVLAWVLSAMCCSPWLVLLCYVPWVPHRFFLACSCNHVCNWNVLLCHIFSVNPSHTQKIFKSFIWYSLCFFFSDDMELSSMCGTRTWKGKDTVRELYS